MGRSETSWVPDEAELLEKYVQEFTAKGFCVLPEALQPNELAAMRTAALRKLAIRMRRLRAEEWLAALPPPAQVAGATRGGRGHQRWEGPPEMGGATRGRG